MTFQVLLLLFFFKPKVKLENNFSFLLFFFPSKHVGVQQGRADEQKLSFRRCAPTIVANPRQWAEISQALRKHAFCYLVSRMRQTIYIGAWMINCFNWKCRLLISFPYTFYKQADLGEITNVSLLLLLLFRIMWKGCNF